MKKLITVITLSIVLSTPALADMKTVTLSVSGMTCAACPITVKKALNKVDGVEKTKINFKEREAVVTFDDTKTAVEALMEATKDAGYPSTLKPSASLPKSGQ